MIKPIEMICVHDEKGNIKPFRFKMVDDAGEQMVINVKEIVDKREENTCLIYNCLCVVNGVNRTFEIKYRKDTCRWFVSRIV